MEKKENSTPSPVELPSELASRELLDSLADGAYITDVNRKILFWNRAAERITGWRREEVVGRSCFDKLLSHIDKDGHPLCGQEHCPLHRSIVTGQPSLEPLLIFAQRKSGLRAPMETSVAPLRNPAGEVIGGIEVFRDLSEAMQDLLRAKGIQEMGLKSRLPPDERLEFEVHYQPHEVVGGDFYQVETRDADRYTILLADVMGHGVAAALYTMQLRLLWDEHHTEVQEPGRLLEILNKWLHPLVGDAGYFATAVCATYNADSGRLHCVRAGHPAPLLFRAGGAVEPVGPPHPPLGMHPDHHYEEAAAQLEPGDALLLFTDGALELYDAAGQELGVAGVARLVREQTTGQECCNFHLQNLAEQLLRFTNHVQLPDDLTLLKLQRRT